MKSFMKILEEEEIRENHVKIIEDSAQDDNERAIVSVYNSEIAPKLKPIMDKYHIDFDFIATPNTTLLPSDFTISLDKSASGLSPVQVADIENFMSETDFGEFKCTPVNGSSLLGNDFRFTK